MFATPKVLGTEKGAIIVITLCFLWIFSALPTWAQSELAGDWEGALVVPGNEIPVILHVFETHGQLSATMDSPLQNVFGLEVTTINLDGTTLTFTVGAIGGGFEGEVDGQTIAGTWSQGGGQVPLNLKKIEGETEIKPPARPQTDAAVGDYESLDVSFEGGDEGITLAGTLTPPKGEEPFPAFILLSGSGTQDRDHTVAGHKTFLVLADFLTKNGYAVLRLDDRGIGGSNGDPNQAGVENLARDALAARNFLGSNSRIDGNDIGLIGISQGGMVATRAGITENAFSKLILLSSPVRGFLEVVPYQVGAFAKAAGHTPETVELSVQNQRYILDLLVSAATPLEGAEKVKNHLVALGTPEQDVAPQVMLMASPAYYSFLDYDPAADLALTNTPALAIYGGKDLQVSAEANTAILEGLKAEGRENIDMMTFPNLNHLLQTAETGLIDEYAQIEETISPEVLDAILSWLEAHE